MALRMLRNDFPNLNSALPLLWTNSYLVATTGGASLAAGGKHVEEQKSH